MAVFTLEDAQGGVEVIVFPEAYQRSAALIETGTLVLVRGKLERDDESVRILASEIAPLDSVRERLDARGGDPRSRRPPIAASFEALGEIFSRHRGDRRVSFELETGRRPTAARARAMSSSQIRVRPVAGARRGGRAGRRARARWRCGDMHACLKRSTSKSRSPSS